MKRTVCCPLLLSLLVLVPSACIGVEQLACPAIPEDGYPALVFVEGGIHQHTLFVSYFGEGVVRRREIMISKSIEVEQLDNAIFLVEAQHDGEPGVFVIDLANGRMKHVAEARLLRSVPGRRKAMLMKLALREEKVDLVELDLDTLETKPAHVLTRKQLGETFDGIGPGIKISPDFKHLAYARLKGTLPRIHEPTIYVLSVLDLSTMEVRDMDANVRVEIGMFSSYGHGRPPFEWLSDDELLYQHIPNGNDENDRMGEKHHVLKIANIETGAVREVMRPLVRLTLNGGTMRMDPVTGRIEYHREWLLDLGESLVAKNYPFSVERSSDGATTVIRRDDTLIYEGDARCMQTCLSASGKHFAYMLRPEPRELHSILYAALAGEAGPIKVAEGPYWPTRPIAWVEAPSEEKEGPEDD